MNARPFGIAAALVISALIHFAPLPGLLGGAALQGFYGLPAIPDPATELLLRHRAVMFALMGALLLVAIARPALRVAAVWLVLVSDIAFAVLWLGGEGLPDPLRGVAMGDGVSIVALVAVLVLCRRSVEVQGD